MCADRPLYLHFLDRELGKSVGVDIENSKAELIVKCLLLGTTSQLCAGLSIIWESSAMYDLFPQFLSNLVQTETLDLISNHKSLDEFLATRIALYSHDSKRYPMYFDDREMKIRQTFVPTSYKEGRTTPKLAQQLDTWSTSGGDESEISDKKILQIISKKLKHRQEEAITYSYFAPDLEIFRSQPIVEGNLRRRISMDYTKHYLDLYNADIPTGIKRFDYFENLSQSFPLFDVDIIRLILNTIGFSRVLNKPWKNNEQFWIAFMNRRGSHSHIALREQITKTLRILGSIADMGQNSKIIIRQNIKSIIRHANVKIDYEKAALSSNSIFEQGLDIFTNIEKIIMQTIPQYAEEILKINDMKTKIGTCDVLIIVATDIERDAFIQCVKNTIRIEPETKFGQENVYLDFGYISDSRVVLVKTEMGSATPGGSILTVRNAIEDTSPEYILMIGIAFGVDSNKQKIGHVLVSKQLQPYESQRIGINSQYRGDKVTASARIIRRLEDAKRTWIEGQVEFGLILTGEKLIDNLEFRNKLISSFPEAIGGEMEAAGLYLAANEKKLDWVVVKAICDWADGNKNMEKTYRQQKAASKAANFILHAISKGGFIRRRISLI